MTTQLIDQVAGLAEGPEHLEKVVITRPFLKAVLEALRRPRAVSACPNCGEHPAFQIDTTRDTPAYSAMRQAGIDRMHERAAATRGVL